MCECVFVYLGDLKQFASIHSLIYLETCKVDIQCPEVSYDDLNVEQNHVPQRTYPIFAQRVCSKECNPHSYFLGNPILSERISHFSLLLVLPLQRNSENHLNRRKMGVQPLEY